MPEEFKIGDPVEFKWKSDMKITKLTGKIATCEYKYNGETKSLLIPIELLKIVPDSYEHLGYAVKSFM